MAALGRGRDLKVGQCAVQTLRKEDDMRVTQGHTFLVVRCRVGVREVGGRWAVGGWGRVVRGGGGDDTRKLVQAVETVTRECLQPVL